MRELIDKTKPMEYAANAIEEISKKENIVLFGAAEYGKVIGDYLRENDIYPIMYCDNCKQKIGTEWNGLRVVSPCELTCDMYIVITCNAFREITEQLNSMGISKDHIYYFNVNWLKYPEGKQEFILEHLQQFEEIYNILADQKSKKVFLSLLNYKMTYKSKYIEDIVDEIQYFDSELIKLKDDVVFIDAGSYIGDTLEMFIKFTKCKYGKVICLEPVENNVKAIKEFINNNKVENVDVYQLGASDSKKVLYFDSINSMAAREVDNGGERIECDSIDNICVSENYDHIDFIKMDIEGSECSALKGARDTIQKYSPILAICVYHKEDDFYIIPNLIKSINPNYDFYFRHYELSDEETVCFAIPRK